MNKILIKDTDYTNIVNTILSLDSIKNYMNENDDDLLSEDSIENGIEVNGELYPYCSAGRGRFTIGLKDDLLLKVSYNGMGFIQNKNESLILNNTDLDPRVLKHLAQIYYFEENGSFVLEKKYEKLDYYVKRNWNEITEKEYTSENIETIEAVLISEVIQEIFFPLIKIFPTFDFGEMKIPFNWGVDEDGTLVCFDFGMFENSINKN